tara:strand:- start:334 stop:762 length:429 start_codon:yes stop_codon:yes gene_type:complete
MADIPNEHHIARHCRGRNVDGDDVDGEEFRLRLETDPPEEYLSVHCFELTNKSILDEQLVDIRTAIPRTLKPKDRIARLNVGVARQRVFQNVGRLVICVSKIVPGSATYCGVYDIPQIDRINKAVGEQLAFAASGNLHAAVI